MRGANRSLVRAVRGYLEVIRKTTKWIDLSPVQTGYDARRRIGYPGWHLGL